MIKDVPSPQDFCDAGIELFNFAWDTVAALITNFSDAEQHWGVDTRRGVGRVLGFIKETSDHGVGDDPARSRVYFEGQDRGGSPYLLLSESPTRWPSPYDGHEITFSEFKTVDAQDLIRLHDTVQDSQLVPEFVEKFNALRTKRNTISHSIDKKLQVHTSEVIEAILFLHKALFPMENWAKTRATFIRNYPDATLSGGEYSTNDACRELEIVLDLLPPASVEAFFGIGKQRRYLCPSCLGDAGHLQNFDHKLAVLRPKAPPQICSIARSVIASTTCFVKTVTKRIAPAMCSATMMIGGV